MLKYFTKKKVIWAAIAVIALGSVGYAIFFRGNAETENIQTDTVKRQDLSLTVLATGQVVSGTDLDLSFKSSGVVKRIGVAEGDHVESGQTLAVLDQTDALAALTSAQGNLAQAKANYAKVLAGVSNEAIVVAEKAVDAAKVSLDNANTSLVNTTAQQDNAIANAYRTLLNTSITAIPAANNPDSVIPTFSGTYTGSEEGSYHISIYSSGNGLKFQTSGLELASGDVRTGAVSMGMLGLAIQFASSPATADTWTVTIPNVYASGYVTNYNAYQAALKTRQSTIATAEAAVKSAEIALEQARANLAVQKAEARPADIDVARAQILTAQGQVETAQAVLANTTLRAPVAGTITQVDIKVGEHATALKEVMIVQDIDDLYVEANISEASIASLRSGQHVDFTFDALGPDRHFTGSVVSINPASTVISGIVNYKVKAAFEAIGEIKPGMTANMTILAAERAGALAIPQRAVVNKEGKRYVRVIDNAETKTYHEVEVETGLAADEGLVEMLSGLSEGQEVVIFIK
ncbi:MAG: efflux RND transporter periplasmic adaptor subunit [bacterium]|nr:efflux RND transporter periplasmic adaptor subunit [bacterium]